jgi:hypothetical protein
MPVHSVVIRITISGIKSSKYPGVCWDKWTNNWVVNLSINGKQRNIGRFKTEADAFKAYRDAVKKYCNEDVILELQ